MPRGSLYLGWIPNVAGRLSFSHIGATSQPRPCVRENTGNSFGRRIAAAQRRPLSDWLLPDAYFKFLYDYSADWVFVLVAISVADRADQISRLQGEVLIFERRTWDAMVQDVGGTPYQISELFDDGLRGWAREPRPSEASDALPENHLQLLRASALFSWAIGLRRSGVVWVRLNAAACDVAFADDYTGIERAPNDQDIHYVANQVFFFLKDISHAHRHHPPGSDTITELGPLDRRHTWVIDTHYRIHRKIVEMRRSHDTKVLFNASGMLAYLSALRKAVEREFLFTGDPRRRRKRLEDGNARETRNALTYNNTEIEASLKSAVEVLKWRQTQWNIIRTALPALVIAALAFTGGAGGGPGSDLRDHLASFYNTHPKQTLGVAAIALSFAPFYYGAIDLYSIPMILRAKRILGSASINQQAWFWFGGAIAMFAFASLLLAQAQIMTYPWAGLIRAHPRAFSWGAVALSLTLAISTVYLIPFWTTRRDLLAALSRRLRRT